MTEINSAIIMAAVELLRLRENHPHLTKFQKNIVINLVNQNSSVNQLPTGSGKTLPIILLPMVLDVLRDNFKQNVPNECRVLYIVPLGEGSKSKKNQGEGVRTIFYHCSA